MQAIITQEELEEYQRLKRESIAEGKIISARVADEMEKLALSLKSSIGPYSILSRDDVCQAIEKAACMVRNNPLKLDPINTPK